LLGERNIGGREGERDEDRGDVGALGAIARLVAILATATLHGHGVAVAEILHFELGFDARGVDV
jgi:hypothetical protein